MSRYIQVCLPTSRCSTRRQMSASSSNSLARAMRVLMVVSGRGGTTDRAALPGLAEVGRPRANFSTD